MDLRKVDKLRLYPDKMEVPLVRVEEGLHSTSKTSVTFCLVRMLTDPVLLQEVPGLQVTEQPPPFEVGAPAQGCSLAIVIHVLVTSARQVSFPQVSSASGGRRVATVERVAHLWSTLPMDTHRAPTLSSFHQIFKPS